MREEKKATKRNIPELLAPAGGLMQLRAAVNNGADAVYLGGSRYNARAKADNFTLPQLRDAIRYAHERGVKIYVTFNTLLKDRELPEALDYAACLWDIGADAVIVQDMGLVRLLGRYLPDLPLHLSTQGTVTGKRAVDLMREFGIRRIVPARELPIRDLREMVAVCSAEPAIELEVFVHGALCMGYSGQCQMSRLLGAAGQGTAGQKGSTRSANRGLCAQPCRLPYTDDQGRTGYFLSPKDLCLLEDLPVLAEAGVDSLKIEGRLKSPEYVAVVTGIYRRYLDQYRQTGTLRVSPEDKQQLLQIYSRGGFTRGYLFGNPGDRILSGETPKHAGIRIGEVRSVVDADKAGDDRAEAAGAARKGAVLVDVARQGSLEEGDGVEFRQGRNDQRGPGRGNADRPPVPKEAGGIVTFRRALPGGLLRIGDMKGEIHEGDEVFRMSSRLQQEEARATFDAADPAGLDRQMRRHLPVSMEFTGAVGHRARLRIREEGGRRNGLPGEDILVEVRSEEVLEEARRTAADPDRTRQQLGKLGGTPFQAAGRDIRVDLDGRCAIPVSEINRMRREGIRLLLQEKGKVRRKPADERALAEAEMKLAGQTLKLPVMPEVDLVPVRDYLQREGGGPCLPYIDSVSLGKLDAFIEEHFREIVDRLRRSDTGILIRTNSWIKAFLDAGVRVYGGCGLNVYNEEARLAFEEMGVKILEPSHETGISAEGRIPLMITEHPIKSKTLTDRKGQVHRIEVSAAGDKTIVW